MEARTERERLIEIIGKSQLCLNSRKLADYLLQNGVTVLPCKVGDTVYVTDYTVTGDKIFDCTVDIISHYLYSGNYYYLNWRNRISRMRAFTSDDIGKTVFLTIEEAIKDFAERLKNKLRDCACINLGENTYYAVRLSIIDDLVKEMTEGKE